MSIFVDKEKLQERFDYWRGKLRLTPGWDVRLEWVDDPAWDFAYRQFFTSLEITVEELAKCFLLEFGEDRELSFGRCAREKSFNELYDGLNNLE